jgi:hypothetical protein
MPCKSADSDSVNLGSNPSSPASNNIDVLRATRPFLTRGIDGNLGTGGARRRHKSRHIENPLGMQDIRGQSAQIEIVEM